MNLSGNQKLGALLAGILPLVASIYGQQAERRQQNQTHAAEQQAHVDAERQAADASDSASAKQLNQAFKQVASSPAGTNSTADLCSTLHTSLELLRQSAPTPKTEAVVAAWLTYRVEGDGRRLVCDCKRTIGIAHSSWLPDDAPNAAVLIASRVSPFRASSDGKSVHSELIFALNAANTECNLNKTQPDRQATGPQSPTRVPTTPTPTGSPAAVPEKLMPGQETPLPPPPPPATDFTSPRRPGALIYFQVPDKDAKDRIAKLRSALEHADYRVPEIEVVGEKRAPRCAELRYVYANDTSEATTLLNDLNKTEMLSQLYGDNPATSPPSAAANQPDPRVFVPKRMSRYEGRSLNRVYELWLPSAGGRECQK